MFVDLYYEIPHTMYLEQCTDDQLKKIYEEFNATEETVQRDVKTLIEWLEKQPHLPNVKGQYMYLACKSTLIFDFMLHHLMQQ